MKEVIEKLTDQQWQQAYELRDSSLSKTLDHNSFDKNIITDCVNDLYRRANLEEPLIIWCDSPLQANYYVNLLRFLKENDINFTQIVGETPNPPGEQLGQQLRDKLREKLGEQISEKLWLKISDQLGKQPNDKIDKQLREKLGLQLREQMKNKELEYIGLGLFSESDLGWAVFYKFLNKIVKNKISKDQEDLLNVFYNLATHGGQTYCFKKIVFSCQKPISVHFNGNRRLHNESGPAALYKDGLALYSIDGIRVPQYLAETPASELDIEFFKNEKNADVKAIFIKKFGIEKMLELGKSVDTYKNYSDPWYIKSEYELIDMSAIFESFDYAPFLKMKNQTTGVWHLEGVAPECRTINDALSFRLGVSANDVVIKSIK